MLRIENVNYRYNSMAEGADIRDLHITVGKGECVLFCGRSGSGKTTITKLINSLIPNYYENGKLEGQVLLSGMDTVTSEIYEVSRVVSSVFQNPKTQFFNLNTTSEILFYLENRGYDREYMVQKLEETSSLFGIAHLFDRDIFELSGGEKQIVAIAAAYASGTEMILLDEPSSNLDENSTKVVGEILAKIKENGKTILISEHRFYYIKDIVDKVYYVNDGRVEHEWTKEQFFSIGEDERKRLGLRRIEFEELDREKEHGRTAEDSVVGNANAGGKEGNQIVGRDEKVSSASRNDKKTLAIEVLRYDFKGINRRLQMENLSFDYGNIIGVYGKNGIGKSTFIRLLMGLDRARKEKIVLAGKASSRRRRTKHSYLVMQDVNHQLFTDSVETEVCLGKSSRYDEADVEKVLEHLNIHDLKDKHPMGLSGGQKQRVAIASAILSGAEIICFDEPTSGMDYDNMMRISKLVKETINDDIVIFIISHDHEFLNNTADEIFDISRYNIEAG